MSGVENPSAFPQSLSSDGPFGGMTLRDWFAGQALAPVYRGLPTGSSIDELAERAYSIADAMLAERGKGGAA